MRKTLVTLAATLMLAGGFAAPSIADTPTGGGPLPPCSSSIPSGTPCRQPVLPSCVVAPTGTPCTPDPCVADLATADAKVASEHTTILRQRALIKRLRHRLAQH